MSAPNQALDLDLESIAKVLGPAGMHEFLDQAVIQPVLQREAGAVARQHEIGAAANQDAALSPKGLFAVEERFDAFSFHDILNHVGVDNMGDEELVKDLRKRHSSVIVRSKSRNSKIIVPATKYTRLPAPVGQSLVALRKTAGRTIYSALSTGGAFA